MMERQIIGRGLLAGALAGVLAFVFAKIFLEPVIGRAIEFEDGTAAAHEAVDAAAALKGGTAAALEGGTAAAGQAHHHEAGVELFSRGIQSTVGMGFGVLAFAVALGALFAVVFAVAYGRVGNVSARLLSVRVAGLMFASLWLVPALKYPPNPPATSDEATITQRALLYLLLVALSAVFMVAAVYLGHQLTPKLGGWNATLVGGAAYVVAALVAIAVLPTVDETPGPIKTDADVIVFPGFPAVDLYEFRLYGLLTQLIIWTTIGLVFATLISRVLDGKRPAAHDDSGASVTA